MTPEQIVCLAWTATAGLMIVVSVPLLKDRVPPNRWYGFRTPASLASPEAWYRANRLAGAWCVAQGVGLGVLAVGTYLSGLTVIPMASLLMGLFLASTVGMIIHVGRSI